MGLRLQIGKALAYGAVVLALAVPLFAQPATTEVADTLYAAFAGPTFCSGTISISWTDFYSKDGFLIKAGQRQTPVDAMGAFSVLLVPTNTNVTPANGIYRIQYNLQPTGCASTSEAWNVPSSMTPVTLNDVRTLPVPPPSLIPITALMPPIIAGTYQVCYVNGIVQWTMCSGAGSVISGSGTAGKLAKFTAATVIGNAAVGDITSNFSGCSGTQYLGFDGACHTPISQLTSAAIIGLWSGCSGVQYLGADGACHNAAGAGVTSVGLTMPSWFSVANSPVTGAATLAVTAATGQTGHQVIGTCGAGTSFAPCSLTGAELPNPSATTLGGVQSITVTTHQFLTGISTSGVPSKAQPACGDLSDGAAGCSATSLPPNGTAGGDLSGTYPNPTVAQVHGAAVPASAVAVATNSSRQLIAATFQGNGAKVQASTGTTTTNDCVKFDANGNTVDAGAACSAGGGGSGINLVQYATVARGTVTTVAYLNNVVSGNLLMTCAGWEGATASNPTATDTVGTTYAVFAGTNGHGGNGNSACIGGLAAGSGANTVTITYPSGSSFEGAFISEWKGVLATVDGSTTATTPANFRTVNITNASAGDLVIMSINGDSSGGVTACAGGVLFLDSTSGSDSGGLCYTIQNATGGISNGVSNSSGATALVMFGLTHP